MRKLAITMLALLPAGILVAQGVRFTSTDTALARAFAWAKATALSYKGHPGDPVGPWYESALPPRHAFCMRDVSHQSVGAAILGMDAENRNMFTLFTRNVSAAKDWCSYWEMNRSGVPAPDDYRSDREFWYNLNANFDVLDASWRLYRWTGDSTYISDARFQAHTMGDYIRAWTLEADSLLTRPAHPNAPVPYHEDDKYDRCRGLPSYSEGVHNLKMGVDLVGALYRGMLTYADILAARGLSHEAQAYTLKAQGYQRHLEADWWSDQDSLYYTYYSNDGHFGRDEGETFLLWFGALTDSARRGRTLDHLASRTWNMENTSYLPWLFYLGGRWDQARRYILYLSDPSTARREYPEVSFGVVEGIVQGLMGVAPVARTVSTLYRGTGSSELLDLPILGTTLSIRESPNAARVINRGARPVTWRVRFAGAHAWVRVGGVRTRTQIEHIEPGRVTSAVEVRVRPGETMTVRVQ